MPYATIWANVIADIVAWPEASKSWSTSQLIINDSEFVVLKFSLVLSTSNKIRDNESRFWDSLLPYDGIGIAIGLDTVVYLLTILKIQKLAPYLE